MGFRSDRVSAPEFSCEWFIAAFAVATLIGSAGLAAWVIRPRLWSSATGLVFWGGVANYSSHDAYVEAVNNSNQSALEQARLTNTYYLARVCSQKYAVLRWALITAVAGFGFTCVWFLTGPAPA